MTCPECGGTGRLTSFWPSGSFTSTCWRCRDRALTAGPAEYASWFPVTAGVEVRERAVPVRMKFGKRDDAADQAQRAPGVATPQGLSDDAIMEIAHRTATRYTHRSDPNESSYGFMRHTLLDFTRKVLAAAGVEGRPVTRQEDQFLRNAAKASAKVVAPGKLAPAVTIHLTRDPETGEVLRGDPPGVPTVQAPSEPTYGGVPYAELSAFDKEKVNQGYMDPDPEPADGVPVPDHQPKGPK